MPLGVIDLVPGGPLRGFARLLLERCQGLLDRWVEESTAAAEAVAGLEGHSLAVHVEGLGLALVLHASGGRVVLGTGEPVAPSATLRGAPLDLLRLMPSDAEASLAGRLKSSSAQLSGKVEVAERFADALRLARPDLEEELARWIGDIPAHELGRITTGAARWLSRAAESARLDATEYLQEETRSLPSRLEARAFGAEVERLRDDVERAAERLERLSRGGGSR